MAQCIQPYKVLLPNGNEQPVRCGKCPTCYASRASEWSVRLMEEESISETSHFVTFTYDNDNVHITEKGFMGLNKDDIQKYFKRLRKAHVGNAKSSIRYYCVGEYGGRTQRPHYHALIFNADEQLIEDAWSIKGKKLGQVFFGTVTGNSVGYCLKYMTKVSKIGLSHWDDRIPQFALMSKDWVHLTSKKWYSGIVTIWKIVCTFLCKMVKRQQCPDITKKESISTQNVKK